MRESLVQDRHGLWLDVPADRKQLEYRENYLAYAFNGEARVAKTLRELVGPNQNGFEAVVSKYPDSPPATVYGLSSGVIGLRLFPNPHFNAEAAAKWNADRYYNDPTYYTNPRLIRPYRVGMSCAFCHANPHPLNAPTSLANPQWSNLSGSIGGQYLRTRGVVGNLLKKESFVYHVLDSQPPGTIDTSLVASDNINNTNAMNAIFNVSARVVRSVENPREVQGAVSAGIPSLYAPAEPIPEKLQMILGDRLKDTEADDGGTMRAVPHILFDGADSIGAYGALARVYLNIGTYHEQWVRLHEPLIGFIPPAASMEADLKNGRVQLPFKLKDCAENSNYWLATQKRVGPLRDYFLRITPTMPLNDAVGIDPPPRDKDKDREKLLIDRTQLPRIDSTQLSRGRRVFAANCIVCHSSIQPESIAEWFIPDDALRAKYLTTHKSIIDRRKKEIRGWEESGEPWDHDPGQWLRDPEYRAWALEVVGGAPEGGSSKPPELAQGFWRNNFLSTDMRIPVNYVGTNSGRGLATNATDGHMWEDFASHAFRRLPAIGSISYFNPFTEQDELFTPRHVNRGSAPLG
ncbi:MAG TPA: hypothetical protein VK968_02580, partial [Roseimicrobium sp.]|nr:hypothetical protein [Roseimicrobium sp.]